MCPSHGAAITKQVEPVFKFVIQREVAILKDQCTEDIH